MKVTVKDKQKNLEESREQEKKKKKAFSGFKFSYRKESK